MAEYVLDPAIACKWFLPTSQEPYISEARVLLDRIAKGSDIAHVPALFAFEFGAWLHHEGARYGLQAERSFEAVRGLPLKEHPLDHALAAASHLTAQRHQVDFFTATYIALSEQLICPYLTANDFLAARLAGQSRIIPMGAAMRPL